MEELGKKLASSRTLESCPDPRCNRGEGLAFLGSGILESRRAAFRNKPPEVPDIKEIKSSPRLHLGSLKFPKFRDDAVV